MPRLSFKGRWIAPILSGSKTQTLRLRIPATVWIAETIDAACRWGDPPFARLRVLEIDQVRIGDLTPADARREGMRSLAELIDLVE